MVGTDPHQDNDTCPLFTGRCETRIKLSFDTPCYMDEVLILSSQGVGWTLLVYGKCHNQSPYLAQEAPEPAIRRTCVLSPTSISGTKMYFGTKLRHG